MTDSNFAVFSSLVYHEIFDHPHLLKLFTDKIIDEKGDLIMTIDQIEEIYCNGNIDNNNPFLKMMIIELASDDSTKQQMLKRGWITDKNMKYREYNRSFAIALNHIHSKEGKERERGDEVEKIEILDHSHLSQSTIKFFLDNNLRFLINSSYGLYEFLKRLDYIGGLSKEISSIDKIIKLKDVKDETYKCNKDIFKEYLDDAMKRKYISRQEYQRFIKLVE